MGIGLFVDEDCTEFVDVVAGDQFGRLSDITVGRGAFRGLSYTGSWWASPTDVVCRKTDDSPLGRNPNMFWIISCIA